MDGKRVLTNRIWDTENCDFIAQDAFYTRLKLAQFVLLGEIHTNYEHHLKQAEIINNISDSKIRPAVCFEMLEVTNQEKIDDYLKNHTHNAEGFGNAIDWDSQWNLEYEMYKPIFEIALAKNLPVVAANVPRILAKKVAGEGLGALTPNIIGHLGLDRTLPQKLQQELTNEIWESHFGQTGHNRDELRGLLESMALAQKLRDATMAYVMLNNQKSEKQILIAGNGHVRADRGVPYHLINLGAEENHITSVVLIETETLPEFSALAEKQEWLKDKKFPYTFIVFTQ